MMMTRSLLSAAVAALGVSAAPSAMAQTPPTAGLQVWLDASKGVETSGGNVTFWRDQAIAAGADGQGRQNAIAVGAVTTVTGVNGKPTMRFDGNGGYFQLDDNSAVADPANDDSATSPNLSGIFPSAARLFIVATPSDDQFSLFGTLANDGYYRFVDTNAYMGAFRTTRIEQYPNGGEGAGNPNSGTHVWELRSNSAAYQSIIDGVARTAQGAQYNAGNDYRIANPVSGCCAGPFTGDISEVLIYNTDTVDTSAVYSYLNSKYGVVPEPTALSLIGIGGILAFRRRSR